KDKSGKHSVSNIPSGSSSAFEPPSCAPSGGLLNLVDTSLSVAPAHLPDPWSAPLAVPSSSLNNNTSSPSPSTSFNNTNIPQSTFPLIPIDDPWSPK
ncbi:unnamed protein product, partial [Schistosoma intercalatum]